MYDRHLDISAGAIRRVSDTFNPHYPKYVINQLDSSLNTYVPAYSELIPYLYNHDNIIVEPFDDNWGTVYFDIFCQGYGKFTIIHTPGEVIYPPPLFVPTLYVHSKITNTDEWMTSDAFIGHAVSVKSKVISTGQSTAISYVPSTPFTRLQVPISKDIVAANYFVITCTDSNGARQSRSVYSGSNDGLAHDISYDTGIIPASTQATFAYTQNVTDTSGGTNAVYIDFSQLIVS